MRCCLMFYTVAEGILTFARSWQLTLGDIDYCFYMSIFIVFDRFGKPRVAFFSVLNLSTLPSSIVFYQFTLFHLEKSFSFIEIRLAISLYNMNCILLQSPLPHCALKIMGNQRRQLMSHQMLLLVSCWRCLLFRLWATIEWGQLVHWLPRPQVHPVPPPTSLASTCFR